MPFKSQRAKLVLTDDLRSKLAGVAKSRTEELRRVERAQILLGYADGETISAIARRMRTNRPRVERTIDKALQLGPLAALGDLRRSGRPRKITPEARAWLVALACQKPKELGYSYELWTTELLARHVREHCQQAGHPSLAEIARGTVSKILRRDLIRPHKIRYYLERRDPEFDRKMVEVLQVYREVQVIREQGGDSETVMRGYISYDEKPGIQAIGNTSEDLPPVPGTFDRIAREHEYVRYGTMDLIAGIDLLTGQVHGFVAEDHCSAQFIRFLKLLDAAYPPQLRIRIVLDNHSTRTSKETRAYLATVPNRFEFIFTPKHGSWLNLIECFFARMAKTVLRGIRVGSKEELAERIELFLEEANQTPVPYRWEYGLDELT